MNFLLNKNLTKFLNLITFGWYNFFKKNNLYYKLKKAVLDSNSTQILYFLEKGAIANDLSILKIPVLNKNKMIIELLLNNGGEANISPPVSDIYDGKYHTFSETHFSYPLLEIAIENEDIDIIKLLLDHGVNSHEGMFQALSANNTKIVIFLIENTKQYKKIFRIFKRFFSIDNRCLRNFYNNLDLSEHIQLDEILLATAIYMKNMDDIKMILVKHTPSKCLLFDSINNSKSTIFFNLLTSFMESNNFINLSLIKDVSHRTLLHEIAINGNREQAIYLLNKDRFFDINANDDYNRNAIYYSLFKNNKGVYSLLHSIN